MADMDAKGRRTTGAQRGEEQYRAKLTDEIVLEARRRYAAGEEIRDIARGCATPSGLKAAIYGVSWQHLPMPSYTDRERPKGAKSGTCPQGHEFTEENTGFTTDKQGYRNRYCKQCNRDKARAYAARKRAARLTS
jgi:hypothetical protein